MNERQDAFEQDSINFENVSNEQLNNFLSDAENTKLFATGVAIIGIAAIATGITVELASNNDYIDGAMLLQQSIGTATAFISGLAYLVKREETLEILKEAQQRGLSVTSGLHRSLEVPHA